jgi:uncharacterized protein (TIGR04255 family)
MKKLPHAPIIEAVLDIDCDMPPKFDLAGLEQVALEWFREKYPVIKKQYLEEFQIKMGQTEPANYLSKRAMRAFQFFQEGEKQIIQIRSNGFSFNRLAPYSSLDDYLPEIERTWKIFVGMASPVQIRTIQLRYINRIFLPLGPGGVNLSDFFKIYPTLPVENLTLTGFINQYLASEKDTGNLVNVILTSQPVENGKAPMLFDNSAVWTGAAEVGNWAWILSKIISLRDLKNRIFENTLTEPCLNLFL